MILAHGQMRFPRNVCALSMAAREIFVSTINDLSTLASEALSKDLCSLNGRKGCFFVCATWYKHIECQYVIDLPTISQWQAYSHYELRADDNSTLRVDIQYAACAFSMAGNVASCVERR